MWSARAVLDQGSQDMPFVVDDLRDFHVRVMRRQEHVKCTEGEGAEVAVLRSRRVLVE